MAGVLRSVRGALAALVFALPAAAGEATVAVAANFLATAERLAAAYGGAAGHEIVLAHGSTGRLYAQIVNGAPFDAYLAADAARPTALDEAGLAVERAPYALGRLVLVARAGVLSGVDALAGHTVVLAEPRVAPYGAAAEEALAALGGDGLGFRAVYGDSVGQVAAIFATGNADAAFLSAAQTASLTARVGAVDVFGLEGFYSPIRQEAVLLPRAMGNPAAEGFFGWLFGDEARAIIASDGYGLPE